MDRLQAIVTTAAFLVIYFLDIELAHAESRRIELVRATYRVENSKSTGSGFVVRLDAPDSSAVGKHLLITAAHAFEKMDGEQATVVLRQQNDAGVWSAVPRPIRIRDGKTPQWRQHPEHDVAAIRLPGDFPVEAIPVSLLADANDWQADSLEPGGLVRSVGYPHAAQFKPSPVGFPLTRIGCIASYPLTPFARHPTFLVDYNTFEGDSGGPVYAEVANDGRTELKIIGLVHGQHFIDERYSMIYQSGLVRKRLGLAIIVNSQAILETIDLLQQKPTSTGTP